MKTLFTVSVMIAGYILPATIFSQTTYVDNGTANTYTLQTGDSLYIKQGTFTGTINDWNKGGKVTVASAATFKPAAVNGYRSSYLIYGTAILPALQTEKGFVLQNYGTITVNGGTQMNDAGQNWTNFTGGTINFTGAVALNVNSGNFTNYADIIMNSDLSLYSKSNIINKKNLTIKGNFNSSDGTITNEGMFYAQKRITFGGKTTVTNTCRVIAEDGISIDNKNASVYNSGILWASNKNNSSAFTNSGTVTNSDKGVIKSGAFTNYGNITGNGFMYITGKSTLGGDARVGKNGNTSDSLKIYTVNRSKTTQIFDDQWGTVYGNAKYAVIAAPDTVGTANYACSAQYSAMVLLPVTWDAFNVKLSGNIPVLNWSAGFDEGTKFLVQRSFNGADFSAVANLAGITGVKNYTFSDNGLSGNFSGVVYYRICAVEPTGTQKFTETKMISINKAVAGASLQAKPNPFSSQFNINYQAAQKGMITVKVFNINGQVQLTKHMNVNSGNNTIAITETAKWTTGIYVIQLVEENGAMFICKID